MIRNILFSIFLMFLSILAYSQDFKSEDDLKKQAQQLFEEDKLVEASPLYAQLLSLYPQDPNYNYKYGACLLSSSSDREKPLKYLKFAASKSSQVEPLAFYFLGKAHHLNYNFAQAVKFYSKFKTKASSEQKSKYDVERQIEMCKNGNVLLSKLNEVQVVEKQTISRKDFFRIYDLKGIDGKIITKPEEFKTKYDQKVGEKSIIYLPKNATEVYFSSYGKKGENGRDIYKTVMLGNRSWSEPVNLGASINTPYDENYPFIHPDGRTLYFASKGHNSMGGYDLFMSVFDEATSSWKAPENLDFAFSSVDDDVMFVTDRDKVLAYFASNRSNESDEITVYKVMVDKAPADLSVIKGKYIAENNPNSGKAKITIIDPATKKTIGIYETDENGNYSIEIASNGGSYQFNLETTDDSPIHTGVVDIPRQDEFEVLGQELRLVGTGEQQQLVIKNIFDGSTAANNTSSGPQISSELLRMKAQLDINLSADALATVSTNLSNEKEDNKTQPNEIVSNESKPEVSNLSAQSLKENLELVKKKQLEKEKTVENAVNIAFSEAVVAKNAADNKFLEVDKKQKSGIDESDIENDRRIAEELAAKAAIATLIAQNIDLVNKEEGISSRDVNSASLAIENKLNDGELKTAEEDIEKLDNQIKASPTVEEFIINQNNSHTARKLINDKELAQLQSKNIGLQNEKQKLTLSIEELNSQISSASAEDSINFQKEKEELELDLNDINFRLSNVSEEYQSQLDVQSALAVEGELYKQLNSSLNNSETLSNATISTEERESLIEDLKAYRENNQLAYFNQMKTSEASESLDLKIGSVSDNLESIESTYQNKFEEVSSIEDEDIKNARKLNVYSNYITDLEGLRTYKLNQQNTIDPNQKNELDQEIAKLDLLIEGKRKEKYALETLIADNNKAISDNSSPNSDNNQSEVDDTQAIVNSNESNSSNSSVNNQITDPSISAGSSDSKDLTSNESKPTNDITTEQESTEAEDNNSLLIANIANVEADSPIPSNLSSFSFNKEYSYLDDNSKPELQKVKQTLYAASAASEQSNNARQAAYALPTVEERQKAFEDANEFEEESKKLQLQAIEEFSEVNDAEYSRNTNIISNANSYGENVESNSLDIALLLQDEAEVYYTKAKDIRDAVITEENRIKKESELQKAYDFEMLALSKQREALKNLKLVDEDIAQNETNKSSNKLAAIQTITDADVLAVNEAALAKQKGDSILMKAALIDSSASTIKKDAEILEIGPERDSLMAVYELKNDSIIQLRSKASIYYEREEQIKTGFVASENIASGIVKPAIVSSILIVDDSLNITEEEEKQISTNPAYVVYKELAIEREKVVKQANMQYEYAIDLRKKQFQLQKEADVMLQSASQTDDSSEKERRVKQARIIELKAEKLDKSIDSMNNILKVKKYLITEADQKMNASIKELPQLQQAQVVYMASKEVESSMLLAENSEDEIQGQGSTTVPVSSNSSVGRPANDEDLQNIRDNKVVVADNQSLERSTPTVTPAKEDTESRSESSEAILEDGTVNPTNIIRSAPRSPIQFNEIDQVPVKLDQSVFVKLGLNESAYDASNPIPELNEYPQGIVYKVQVGAFRNPIPQDLFKGFAPLASEEGPNGIKRYTAGLFNNENEAISARDEIRNFGYPDAFVVAFRNGKRISISAARNNTSDGDIESSESAGVRTQSNGSNNIQSSSTLNKELSSSFNDSDIESVRTVSSVNQVYYTVQIGVFSKPVKKGKLSNYEDLTVLELSNGLIRYNSGIYDNAADAIEAKERITIDISDAFITAYYKGRRISLNEAARIQNQ